MTSLSLGVFFLRCVEYIATSHVELVALSTKKAWIRAGEMSQRLRAHIALQRFPAPTSDSSQLSVTLSLGEIMPSSGL